MLKTTTHCDLKLSRDPTFNCGKFFAERRPPRNLFLKRRVSSKYPKIKTLLK